MIQINIKKKDLWLLTAIMVFVIATGYVIAWNPSGIATPSAMGHSYNEIQACSDGQILKTSGGSWTCGADEKTNIQAKTCTDNEYISAISSTGVSTCTQAPVCDNCVTGTGKEWTIGVECCMGNSLYRCTSSGWSILGACPGGTVIC